MGRIGFAFRLFFAALSGRVTLADWTRWTGSQDTIASVESPTEAPVRAPTRQEPPARAARPRRSDAITLLATLQREARFVDLVQESLDQYSDQQVGAVARGVLRDCRQALGRIFALAPVWDGAENSEVEASGSQATGRVQITGQPQGGPPFRGRLVHPGWEARQCQLPDWTGDTDAMNVVAPAEIECR